ncbi:MAG: DUF1295 domain-containing protein [Spirochaetales bacterium]|nr:DUF1295 domain-containing protein [Spirochaetales bacterium]
MGEWFFSISPLMAVSIGAAAFSLTAFLFGIFTKDYSWVDRLWSTLPVLFAWGYAFHSGWAVNLLIPAVLISFWGIRLTFNFSRRGGYTGMEDYRWAVLREKISHPVAWQFFHFFFIRFYQVLLFVLFTSPLQRISEFGLVGSFPIWVILPFLFFLIYETIADQQQWNFQRQKYGVDTGGPYSPSELERGFCSSGLFRLCRHPNYFGELGIWWSLYLISAVLTQDWWNWTIIGPGLLTLLFVGSTIFTETITAAKYPTYHDYQKRTSPIVPWFPGK